MSKELMFFAYPPFDYAAQKTCGSAQGVEAAENYVRLIWKSTIDLFYSAQPK
ncbi:MAG: hypothetical protein ACOY0R_15170 [Chloroflexota bacterium]|jgi:hypothetical protein